MARKITQVDIDSLEFEAQQAYDSLQRYKSVQGTEHEEDARWWANHQYMEGLFRHVQYLLRDKDPPKDRNSKVSMLLETYILQADCGRLLTDATLGSGKMSLTEVQQSHGEVPLFCYECVDMIKEVIDRRTDFVHEPDSDGPFAGHVFTTAPYALIYTTFHALAVAKRRDLLFQAMDYIREKYTQPDVAKVNEKSARAHLGAWCFS